MTDTDEILAAIIDSDPSPLPRLEAVVSATSYTIALPLEDAQAVSEKDRWEHLEGVLYRRGCERVSHLESEGLLMFTISIGNASVDLVVQAIAEELDDITGRKLEAAGGETWGMF